MAAGTAGTKYQVGQCFVSNIARIFGTNWGCEGRGIVIFPYPPSLNSLFVSEDWCIDPLQNAANYMQIHLLPHFGAAKQWYGHMILLFNWAKARRRVYMRIITSFMQRVYKVYFYHENYKTRLEHHYIEWFWSNLFSQHKSEEEIFFPKKLKQ